MPKAKEKIAAKLTVAKLEKAATACVSEAITMALTEEEVQLVEHALAEKQIELLELEESKKEFMDEWKEDANPVKTAVQEYTKQLRSGTRDVTMTVYHVLSEDGLEMHLYNEDGEFVMTRPCKVGEGQMAIGQNTDDSEEDGATAQEIDEIFGQQ